MRQMEHNEVGHGHIALVISVIMGIFARIDIGESLKHFSTVVSIVAGIMAVRYYYYSTKKHK